MFRKILFVIGIAIAIVLGKSYHYTHLVVGLVLGTIFGTFVTTIVRYPNASLQNSFFMGSGWLLISYATVEFLPDTASSAVIAFFSYMLLIRAIYRPPKLLPIILLSVLSSIFRKSIAVMVLWPVSKFVYGLL